MFHCFFTHPKKLQLPQEIFIIGNVLLMWLCEVFVTWIIFFGMYVQANLVVYMTMGNLSINQGVKAWSSR
jgi:ABC-type cobalamin transport system permease subunit